MQRLHCSVAIMPDFPRHSLGTRLHSLGDLYLQWIKALPPKILIKVEQPISSPHPGLRIDRQALNGQQVRVNVNELWSPLAAT